MLNTGKVGGNRVSESLLNWTVLVGFGSQISLSLMYTVNILYLQYLVAYMYVCVEVRERERVHPSAQELQ